MLLTSSQVSAAISGGIVLLFTSFLFVSGLLLQRKSVQNLNAVLHPTGGRKGPWESLIARAELAIEAQNKANILGAELSEAAEEAAKRALWDRRAYVSVVRRPEDVCNAVMAVTTLSVQGSPARRVLVYPSSWVDKETGQFKDAPETELIKIAKEEHLLETFGWDVSVGRDGTTASEQSIESYLLGLHDFHGLLYLQANGLILNSSRLDALFDVKMTTGITGINRGKDQAAPAIMFQPGMASTKRSEIFLRDGDGTARRNAGTASYPSTIETSDSLKRLRQKKNWYAETEENMLMKTGYVMLSSARDSREDEGDADAEMRRDGESKRRRGGAIIPRGLVGSKSLADEFMTEYEKHRETVCGSTLSIIKLDGANDWAYS